MKSFVALAALVLAVCVANSQGNPVGNTNINMNSNKNSNFDLLSSFLSSVLIQERKGKAVASRTSAKSPAALTTIQPIADTQEENQQAADEFQAPADESMGDVASSTVEDAPRSEPQEDQPQDDILAAMTSPQFKFIKALMKQNF